MRNLFFHPRLMSRPSRQQSFADKRRKAGRAPSMDIHADCEMVLRNLTMIETAPIPMNIVSEL